MINFSGTEVTSDILPELKYLYLSVSRSDLTYINFPHRGRCRGPDLSRAFRAKRRVHKWLAIGQKHVVAPSFKSENGAEFISWNNGHCIAERMPASSQKITSWSTESPVCFVPLRLFCGLKVLA